MSISFALAYASRPYETSRKPYKRGKVQLWKVSGPGTSTEAFKKKITQGGHAGDISCLAISPCGAPPSLLAATMVVSLWDVSTGALKATLEDGSYLQTKLVTNTCSAPAVPQLYRAAVADILRVGAWGLELSISCTRCIVT